MPDAWGFTNRERMIRMVEGRDSRWHERNVVVAMVPLTTGLAQEFLCRERATGREFYFSDLY